MNPDQVIAILMNSPEFKKGLDRTIAIAIRESKVEIAHTFINAIVKHMNYCNVTSNEKVGLELATSVLNDIVWKFETERDNATD